MHRKDLFQNKKKSFFESKTIGSIGKSNLWKAFKLLSLSSESDGLVVVDVEESQTLIYYIYYTTLLLYYIILLINCIFSADFPGVESLWKHTVSAEFRENCTNTEQKMKFSIKDFFSKCDQIHRKLQIWSYLLEKSLMESFNFCAVKTLRKMYLSAMFPHPEISWIPSRHLLVQSQQWKHQNNMRNLFKVNNVNDNQNDVSDKFETFFWCFYC